MSDQPSARVQAHDFYALPESSLRRELIEGEIVEAMTAPELDHQDVVGSLYVMLRSAAGLAGGKAYVAPVDVELDALNVVQPDVLLLAVASACRPLDGKRLLGPPDLVAEVLSPSTAYLDRSRKFALYERSGVREYWLADPRDRTLEVWVRHDERFERLGVYSIDDAFTSPLAGPVAVADVFEG